MLPKSSLKKVILKIKIQIFLRVILLFFSRQIAVFWFWWLPDIFSRLNVDIWKANFFVKSQWLFWTRKLSDEFSEFSRQIAMVVLLNNQYIFTKKCQFLEYILLSSNRNDCFDFAMCPIFHEFSYGKNSAFIRIHISFHVRVCYICSLSRRPK